MSNITELIFAYDNPADGQQSGSNKVDLEIILFGPRKHNKPQVSAEVSKSKPDTSVSAASKPKMTGQVASDGSATSVAELSPNDNESSIDFLDYF